MIVGYARVNTDGQTLDAQQAALREAGVDRLARSTRDLLNTPATIAEAGATFKSLGRSLVRYDKRPWEVDADGAWRLSRV
jgi:DNA invertase Pin-like site-specific DNA recombinase